MEEVMSSTKRDPMRDARAALRSIEVGVSTYSVAPPTDVSTDRAASCTSAKLPKLACWPRLRCGGDRYESNEEEEESIEECREVSPDRRDLARCKSWLPLRVRSCRGGVTVIDVELALLDLRLFASSCASRRKFCRRARACEVRGEVRTGRRSAPLVRASPLSPLALDRPLPPAAPSTVKVGPRPDELDLCPCLAEVSRKDVRRPSRRR